MVPYYRRAEQLYRVRGDRDLLRPNDAIDLPARRRSARRTPSCTRISSARIAPLSTPLACESIAGCGCCQGYLCARGCKNDASRVCLEPAVREHGARLLDECEVIRLDATRDHVTGVVCRWRQTTHPERRENHRRRRRAVTPRCCCARPRTIGRRGWPMRRVWSAAT